VGTHAVLGDADRRMIRGFAVNKFRGDPRLFDGGLTEIVKRTGWPSLGVLPWFADARRLPAEDALDLRGQQGGALKIAVPHLPRIANFDDLDPLMAEPGVTVDLVPQGRALPGDATVILLPGSKSTIADLAALRAEGWDIDIAAHLRRGGHVIGLCGGYQMLGTWIEDPEGIEGPAGRTAGLGFLDVATTMRPGKRVTRAQGRYGATGAALTGYEIHIGETRGPDCARGWIETEGGSEGAASADGRVTGCYWHGLFASDGFRADWLARIGGQGAGLHYEAGVDAALDGLARHVAAHLDLDALLAMAETV